MRSHWWYRGRRIAVRSLLRRAGVVHRGRVLDYGCGTGNMGSTLAEYGTVTGVDGSADALAVGDFRFYASVSRAPSPTDADFPTGPFELIACLDVLEHVEDDAGLLAQLKALLSPGGTLVVSVPMDPELYCLVDERAGHVRRYTRDRFEQACATAELEMAVASGYIVILEPLARWHRRRIMAGKATPDEEMDVPSAPVNAVLSLVAAGEGLVMRWRSLPDGLSLVAVLTPRRDG